MACGHFSDIGFVCAGYCLIWLKTAGRRFSADIGFVCAGKKRGFCRLRRIASGFPGVFRTSAALC
jgi:hypothetical protein